jgi:hypothetical protein
MTGWIQHRFTTAKILNYQNHNQGDTMAREINLDAIRLTKAAQDRQQAEHVEQMVEVILQQKEQITALSSKVAELEAKPKTKEK